MPLILPHPELGVLIVSELNRNIKYGMSRYICMPNVATQFLHIVLWIHSAPFNHRLSYREAVAN